MTNEKQKLTSNLLHFSIVCLIAGVMLFFQLHQQTACTNKKQQVWKQLCFSFHKCFRNFQLLWNFHCTMCTHEYATHKIQHTHRHRKCLKTSSYFETSNAQSATLGTLHKTNAWQRQWYPKEYQQAHKEPGVRTHKKRGTMTVEGRWHCTPKDSALNFVERFHL